MSFSVYSYVIPDTDNEVAMSHVMAVGMALTYVQFLYFQMGTHSYLFEGTAPACDCWEHLYQALLYMRKVGDVGSGFLALAYDMPPFCWAQPHMDWLCINFLPQQMMRTGEAPDPPVVFACLPCAMGLHNGASRPYPQPPLQQVNLGAPPPPSPPPDFVNDGVKHYVPKCKVYV